MLRYCWKNYFFFGIMLLDNIFDKKSFDLRLKAFQITIFHQNISIIFYKQIFFHDCK